jgi:membrane protein implicated in regulation of membrane protease activity
MAAGLAICLEMLSGTFVLLVIALGCAVGGLVAPFSTDDVAFQALMAALTSGSVIGIWQLRRFYQRRQRERNPHRHRFHPAEAQMEGPAQNLDLGQIVQVDRWDDGAQTRVHYRGSNWAARLDPNEVAAENGWHVISDMEGSTLILRRLPNREASPDAGGY